MKKFFTLIAAALLSMGASAQTATDSYLSIDKYATIDEAGIKGVLEGGTMYSYNEAESALIISAFVGYQSSVNTDGGKQGWITYNSSGSSSIDEWGATAPFMGSGYYKMASSGEATHRVAAVNSSRTYKFRVSNCTKVSMFGATGGSNRDVTMSVYEVVDGTPSTTAFGTASITVNQETIASVTDMDASKIYEVAFTNESSNNSRLYEIAFYTGEGGGEQGGDSGEVTPTTATTWNFAEISTADKDNLNADTENWETAEGDGDTGWKNTAVFAERNVYTALKANGVELEMTKDLQFARDNNAGLQAGAFFIKEGKALNIASSNVMVAINVTKGDAVKVKFFSNSDAERGFNITNADKTSIMSTGKADVKEETLTAVADGQMILKTTASVNLVAITINADIPTGIQTVKANTVANGAIYNMAGQKVDASYKGIVIQNGRKFVNK